MDRSCNYGVVRKINSSEWASPVFTVPKSDNTLRSIGDFRAVAICGLLRSAEKINMTNWTNKGL